MPCLSCTLKGESSVAKKAVLYPPLRAKTRVPEADRKPELRRQSIRGVAGSYFTMKFFILSVVALASCVFVTATPLSDASEIGTTSHAYILILLVLLIIPCIKTSIKLDIPGANITINLPILFIFPVTFLIAIMIAFQRLTGTLGANNDSNSQFSRQQLTVSANAQYPEANHNSNSEATQFSDLAISGNAENFTPQLPSPNFTCPQKNHIIQVYDTTEDDTTDSNLTD